MKFLVLFVLTFSSAFALEKENTFSLSHVACSKEVQTLLAHWKIEPKATWKKQLAENDAQAWKTHGKDLGEWVSLISKSNQETTLVHALASGQIENTHFKKSNCDQVKVEGRPAPMGDSQRSEKYGDEYTDEDLKKSLDSKKNGLLYVWSPSMSLSMPGIAEIKKAAQDLGLPLEVIMDPLADTKDASDIAKKFNLPSSSLLRLNSRELTGRSVTLHYPALVVYRDGKVCDRIQRGYRDHDEYRKIATEIFGGCR